MIITRKEFQAYLRIQHQGEYNMYEPKAYVAVHNLNTSIDQPKYKAIQLNWEDLNSAFIGTNINKVEITVYDPKPKEGYNRIGQANNLVKMMENTLSRLESRIQIVSDYDLQLLLQCNNNLEVFLNKQLYNEEENK